MTAKEIIILALILSVLLSVLGYGMKATLSDALYLFRRPVQLLRTLLAMNVIMPLFVILLVLLFDFNPIIRVTLIALAISPVPPLFPAKPLKAGEREEYVIGLMVGAALFSIILIPITLAILEQIANKPIQVSALAIIKTVLLSVVTPLVIGIAIRHFAPAFAEKVANGVIRFAQVLLILAVLPLLFVLFPSIMQLIGNGTVLAFAAFVLTGILVGHFLGGPDSKDQNILATATSTRHPGIAMAVASANLPQHDLVPAAVVLYLLIAALITIPYLLWLGREKPAPELAKPHL